MYILFLIGVCLLGLASFIVFYALGTWLLWNTPLHRWLGM